MFTSAPRVFLVCLLGAGLILVSAQPANAQVLYGSIVGTVTDQTGAVVPKAGVTITEKGTGQTRETPTDEAGRYILNNVVAGRYDLKVTASGFKPYTETNIMVTINTVARVDVRLEVGQVVETVTVEASATILQTETATVQAEIGTTAVENLPLPRYRNYQSLIDLVPGATPGRFQNAVTDTPARALTTNVNGTNRNNNNTRLDGATNVYIWLPHHTVYVAPAETVQTVNIATNNFDAEQGMAGGAAISVTTKSGSNELHGSAFWLHDNQKIRARNFFQAPGVAKPRSTTNITGGTIGGPIKKNKLFFFGGWEGFRERGGRIVNASVPTPAIRTGNFSATGTTIYDPLTGDATGRGRTAFPGNIIPSQRQSAIIRKLVDITPLPNQSGEFSNFFVGGTQVVNRDNFDIKINWNRNEKHVIWGKYSAMDAQVAGPFSLGAAGGPCLCDGGSGLGNTLVQLSTLGHTYTFSPSFLIDTTLGWSRMGQNVKGPDFGQNFGSQTLGIPGTNGPDPRQSGMPIFSVSGYTGLGNTEGWSPIFRNDQSFTFTQNVSWIKGAHDLRFGFDAIHHHLNHWQPELGSGPRGAFNFGGDITALNGGTASNRFNAYGAFLLGLPSSLGKSVQFIKMSVLEWQFASYVRDRWRISPKLTMTLGMRWEYYPLMTRGYGGIERYDANTNQVFVGGFGNVPRNAGVTTSKKLFAPRLGIAYRWTDKTVIRTGYGITYNPMVFGRPLRGFYPLTVGSDFSGPNSFRVAVDDRGAELPITRGIPEICCPDISGGIIPLPPSALMRTPFLGPLKRGYIQSWNLIVERRLPGDLIASVGYVGTQTVRSFADLNINAGLVLGAGNAGRPQSRPFGRNTDTLLWQGWLSANYHSLQTTINRNFRNGLMLKGAYTWSKAINWTDDDGWTGVSWNAPPLIGRNRANAGFNTPHIFQLGYVYELPFGKGKKWATSGGAAAILGGWQLNGHFSSFTGRTNMTIGGGASINMPGNTQTADQVKSEIAKPGCIGREAGCVFFDPTAFSSNTRNADGTVRFGTSGRNIMRGPGVVNMDLSIFRNFRLTERFKLEFRAESYNFTNTPHFNNPATGAADPVAFMHVTSTTGDFPERQFRLGLRLAF